MSSKEYTIFITCNDGKTYNIHVYKDIFEAKNDLYNMIELEKRRRGEIDHIMYIMIFIIMNILQV